jgi:hypothetical protein
VTALAEEVVKSNEKSVVVSLLSGIEERAKGLNAIVGLVGTLKTALAAWLASGIAT